MPSDVIDLRIYQTGLGQVARRMIRRAIRVIWPDLHGIRLLGMGYATPFLSAISAETQRTVAMMPASQGVLGWSPDGGNVVALAEEGELPFADYSIDRVLLVHALEERGGRAAAEGNLARLAGGGRLLIVAPNRRGIWARLDRTPFGSGRPYTMSQLSHLLREELFTPVAPKPRCSSRHRATAWCCARHPPGNALASAGFRLCRGCADRGGKADLRQTGCRPRAGPAPRYAPATHGLSHRQGGL